MKNTNYVNGKWRITPRAAESGDYAYKNGDWYPKEKTKKEQKPKPYKKTKKMNCGAFPLGKIKEALKITTLYILSGTLGISLAFNVVWYIEKRHLEQQNLQLLEVVNEGVIDE
jgi:hypothetical protein